MITTGTILSMAGALMIAFGIPIFLWGTIGHKVKQFTLCVLCGTAIYLLMHVLVLSPFQLKMQGAEWYTDMPFVGLLLSSLLRGMGFTLCQTAVFFLGMREEKDLRLAAGIGIGQGLAELLLVVGITYFNNLVFAVMINTGVFQSKLTQAGVDRDTIHTMWQQLTDTPGYLYLLSSFERIAFLVVHILCATGMAMFFAKRKMVLGILLSTGGHTVIALIVGALGLWASQGFSYLILSLLTVFALVGMGAVVYITRKQKDAAS